MTLQKRKRFVPWRPNPKVAKSRAKRARFAQHMPRDKASARALCTLALAPGMQLVLDQIDAEIKRQLEREQQSAQAKARLIQRSM